MRPADDGKRWLRWTFQHIAKLANEVSPLGGVSGGPKRRSKSIKTKEIVDLRSGPLEGMVWDSFIMVLGVF